MTLVPTEEQEAIIRSVHAGEHVMVSALAGCAKTSTITMACPLRATLALAFNVKIKKELEERLPKSAKVSTLNGLGHSAIGRALRRNCEVDSDKIFKLCKEEGLGREDLADTKSLVEAARNAGIIPKGQPGKGLVPDTDEVWENLANDSDIHPALIIPARKILKRSLTLALQGTLDFTDQIYISALVLGSFTHYETIFVDEAQDLSPLNHAQLAKMSRSAQLVCVGDPNQAIYAFRGADSASMTNLRRLRERWTDLSLTTTFRCPKSVVERLRARVPSFNAAPSAPIGEVRQLGSWAPSPGSAIICRNNAPLLRTAFRLISRGTPLNFQGRDLGRTFRRMYKEVSKGRENLSEPLRTEQLLQACSRMAEKEPKKSDYWNCLAILLENTRPHLFDQVLADMGKAKGPAVVTLITGHKAKGLEWDTVWHLNPHLIPSKWAESEWELDQEENLRYVIESRTKNKLYLVTEDGLQL